MEKGSEGARLTGRNAETRKDVHFSLLKRPRFCDVNWDLCPGGAHTSLPSLSRPQQPALLLARAPLLALEFSVGLWPWDRGLGRSCSVRHFPPVPGAAPRTHRWCRSWGAEC